MAKKDQNMNINLILKSSTFKNEAYSQALAEKDLNSKIKIQERV